MVVGRISCISLAFLANGITVNVSSVVGARRGGGRDATLVASTAGGGVAVSSSFVITVFISG